MQKEPSGNTIPIIGAWKLVSFQIRTENGEVHYPYGEDAQGSIIYTESGRFSAQVMRPNRPPFESGDQMKGTVEEIVDCCEGCISYYGSYEYHAEAGFVVHHVEGSLFPNWEGQATRRYFALSGNRLRLTTPPTLWGGAGNVGIIEWERID